MNCQNKKIGIMGGTFDPIHIGHLAIAQEAVEYKKLDKVLFIPTGNPPHKTNKEKTKAEIRLEMVKIGIEDNEFFEIDDYEVRREEPSYSAMTMQYLKDKYPKTELYFIMGEDSLLEIESWYRYEDFLNCVTVLVAKRQEQCNKDLENKVNDLISKGYKVEIVPSHYLEISATNIRNKLKNGENPKYYLKQEVYNYIIKEGLYL